MIFVALAIVWAVYLIPRAVNRSEDELALLPAEELDLVSGEAQARAADLPHASAAPARPVPALEQAAARRAVGRRRRVLLVLATLTGLVAVVALVSPLPLWAAAVPGVLVVAWLAVCRVQVRRLDAVRAARALAAEQTAEVEMHAEAELVDDEPAATPEPAPSREFRVEIPAAAPLVVEPDEDTVGLTAADREAALADAMPAGAVWDPRPLTLPTYISKPRARRAPRTLDPVGVSSSGRDARDSRLVAEGAAAGVEATARPREAVGS